MLKKRVNLGQLTVFISQKEEERGKKADAIRIRERQKKEEGTRRKKREGIHSQLC
ncbi:MAG: hypothetical protein JGK24_26430 [Microcoleus sp. PH2017_29_MFU_D_A]|jgi:hypothetical protein|nr:MULTISPECIES: hypothetical protein [unclassified Microcoleus]MCC3414395.1 hypothetical protein [Microcoleus sp. PH2017_02_FOX_O_A]MCC3419456.1 hypothetical protein [Microcoleus sp. PH2017_07_MST_O_A]MCC3466419.1 hypothetical protein [Microcoleus sp. PH2017_06_SFM_O_A]MCC3494515.1 hypothetical protein [Microcoleus sp. PH2017_16_JOR_D_A]MCC3510648.1 hypothetical protein [Microcoleus sp. PH2017_17_BER_D_A]MCC3577765.1 hypothetical protein [Microcoleus sp. PH2017_32_RDM_D_A]